MNRKRMVNGTVIVMFAAVLMIAASGCGTVQHNLDLQQDYLPKSGAKVEVGNVLNKTGQTFDVPVEDMLKKALVDAFLEANLAGSGSEASNLMTNCRIVNYEKGDAFKRWLMPGWGATELTIQCDLLDAGSVVGTINAMRTVTAGGGYTIGAWEKVFAHIASDVAEDIKGKFAAVK